MKKRILLALLLLVAFNVQAKYLEGTVTLKNGDFRVGYISSFMENNILKKLKPGGKITEKFNMDDSMLKFRATKDAEETEKISINDIDEVVFSEGSFKGVRFKPLFVGGVNKKGELELTKKKIWLPLLLNGKIKIYGFSFSQYDGRNPAASGTSYLHFLKHPTEDYAIQPLSELGIMQMMKSQNLTQTALSELKILMEACPEALTSLEELNEGLKVKSERKKLRKRFKEMRSEAIRNYLSAYPNYGMSLRMFANTYWIICEPLLKYNKECDAGSTDH